MRSINPRDYYHPQDQKALWELQQIPGFSAALKAFMKMFSENMIRGADRPPAAAGTLCIAAAHL